MKLEGYGSVNGDKNAMSSSHGELQGQTALEIITEAFLQEHDATDMPVTFISGNQGVQRSCNNPKIHRVGHHHKANMDLHMGLANQSTNMCITHAWVKGHQDKDLTWNTIEELCDLDLTPAATLNVYWDHKASEAHKWSTSDSNGDVIPAEKRALFSTYPLPRKITGKLNEGILQTLHTDDILAYISKKHNTMEDKLIMLIHPVYIATLNP